MFNTSTGNGESYIEEDQNSPGTLVEGVSLTPDGFHRVERERPEGWWEGDLGQIYRPKYFVGGVAVHGSNSVPNYPASHGCVRVTIQAMDFIWEKGLMPMTLRSGCTRPAAPAPGLTPGVIQLLRRAGTRTGVVGGGRGSDRRSRGRTASRAACM